MEHAGFQHQALIYEGADEYLAGTVPFLRAALSAGQPALVAVRKEQGELLRDQLGREADRVRFVPMEEVGRNPAAVIPLWRDFVDENQGPVRGVNELVWADRSPAEIEECHRHEALLNVAFAASRRWSLLCPYDACALPDQELERAASTHRLISREGRTEESAAFDTDPDCLSGRLPPPPAKPDSLSFGLTELSEVRRRVAAAGERAGLSPLEVADLLTATSELAANSVMHGGGTGTLRLWRENDSLLAEVEDDGRIDEPLVGRLRPGFAQEGGRGLWLANQLCDLVQIRSGERGTVVRLHVSAPDRAPGTEPPPAATDPRAEAETSNA
ncbi:MAG TPA: sensor histidine kinase [Solirubrobacterales bacterium]|jgi:anti-sigma regulatory factor (Ser/Thr protein kinase)|nr:sensor histidine kinase [Solirubrobacterales bacterium]